MEQDVLVKRTIGKIKQLPIRRVHEVDDFVEFLMQKANDSSITEGLQRLSSASRQTYDFLNDEPELYSVNDLKVKFA
jgi:uncharacterized radical SAM superfamily Fe-S cluster-containing enzyme